MNHICLSRSVAVTSELSATAMASLPALAKGEDAAPARKGRIRQSAFCGVAGTALAGVITPPSAYGLVVKEPNSYRSRSRKTIKFHAGDALVVHHAEDSRVVILEYEVHGKVLSSGEPYDNRLISVVTTESRKLVYLRDYMDSLAAWTALNGS